MTAAMGAFDASNPAAGLMLTLRHMLLSLESERRLQEQVREEARAGITSMLGSVGVAVPLRAVVGGIVPTATQEARQDEADLMIVGRGAVAEPFGRLRTHAFGIIQRSPCPVLSV